MSLSLFVVHLAMLAMPRIVASIVYRRVRGRIERKPWEDAIQILLFSAGAYAIVAIVWRDSDPMMMLLSQAGSGGLVAIPWTRVLLADGVAVVLAMIASAVHTYRVVEWLGRLIRVTRRFGDQDVWEYVLNRPEVTWAVARDHRTNLTYYGYIRAFSDSGYDRELFMLQVSVYSNESGLLLYESPAVFLSRARHDLSIELPILFEEEAGGNALTEADE